MDLFERLLGRWSFAREISGQGTMVGTAVFVCVGRDRAEYRESGELSLLHGVRLRAEQRYVYERAEEGFAIYFADSRELFQHVTFAFDEHGEWNGAARHLCKADVYESDYCFHADGTFAVRHAVRGPKKDYAIQTLYRRD